MSTFNTDWIDENSSNGRARNGLFSRNGVAEKIQRERESKQNEQTISSVAASAVEEAKKHKPYG